MITTDQIKALRDLTGVSVMQCKKALEEANGDLEKAKVILQKNSKATADKKSDRVFGAGVVSAYVHSNATVGAMVELVCETDFVAKNDEFKALARDIAMHATATGAEYLKASDVPEEHKQTAKEKILLEQQYIKNPEVTIQGLIDSAIQKFGEKIEVARFVRFSVLTK
jgi:elongation factor Ts